MTVQDIRLRCLELLSPNVTNADVDTWIERAKKLEAYVTEGQAAMPPKKRRGRPPKNSSEVGQPEYRF